MNVEAGGSAFRPGPVQNRRPYSNFGTINGIDSYGDANYHGLQVQFEKRYANGLQFLTPILFQVPRQYERRSWFGSRRGLSG